MPVEQVVVSDDSTDDRSRDVIRADYPGVEWLRGPRRGLGPNRNMALTAARGTHVLFLDDDAELGTGFLDRCAARLSFIAPTERPRTILTGVELHPDGRRVIAHEQDFLGFQHRAYQAEAQIRTVVINSALFPRTIFDEHRFDDQLIYGYDEVDLTSRAVRAGYSILHEEDAVNLHRPSTVNREYYHPYIESSRMYVTTKRRGMTEGRRLAAAGYLIVATVHLAVASRRGGRVTLREVPATVVRAARMLRTHHGART